RLDGVLLLLLTINPKQKDQTVCRRSLVIVVADVILSLPAGRHIMTLYSGSASSLGCNCCNRLGPVSEGSVRSCQTLPLAAATLKGSLAS
ncbi:hypothetical protein LY78DRAFT_435181, partial [Colletotrichum sublineola]